MTILVTGAAGFIGRNLVRTLASEGMRVVGVGHGTFADHSHWGLSRWVQGDVTAANLDSAMSGEALETVYHLAGGSSVGPSLDQPLEDFQRTLGSSAKLLDWMRRNTPGARLVAVSSAAVYGGNYSDPIPEQAAVRPVSPYGTHKAMMEMLVRSQGQTFGLAAAIARPFSVYGAGLSKQLLWDVGRKLLAKEDQVVLGGTGEELRDWLHVDDLARALLRIGEGASPSVPDFNVGSGEATSVATVARTLAAALGAAGRISFSGEVRPGNPVVLVSNSQRLKATGWAPQIGLKQGLDTYANWLKGQQ